MPHAGSIVDVGWRCVSCGYEFGFEVCVRPECDRRDYHLLDECGTIDPPESELPF
jgi:hypothetical protein